MGLSMNRRYSACALPSKAAEGRRTPRRCRVGHSHAHFRQVLECAAPAALWIFPDALMVPMHGRKAEGALHGPPAINPPLSPPRTGTGQAVRLLSLGGFIFPMHALEKQTRTLRKTFHGSLRVRGYRRPRRVKSSGNSSRMSMTYRADLVSLAFE